MDENELVFKGFYQFLEIINKNGCEIKVIKNNIYSDTYKKLYKKLSNEERLKIASFVSKSVASPFYNKDNLSKTLYVLFDCMLEDKNFAESKYVIDEVITSELSPHDMREILGALFGVTDYDQAENESSLIINISLSIIHEIGLFLLTIQDEKFKDVNDFFFSSIISRSNLNNYVYRVVVIDYLSKIEGLDKKELYVDRILNRFGKTVLEEILEQYFEKKKKQQSIFFFINRMLPFFINPKVKFTKTTYDVFKSFYFKYTKDFLELLDKYSLTHHADEKALTDLRDFVLWLISVCGPFVKGDVFQNTLYSLKYVLELMKSGNNNSLCYEETLAKLEKYKTIMPSDTYNDVVSYINSPKKVRISKKPEKEFYTKFQVFNHLLTISL